MDAETAALFPDRLVESELGLVPQGWEVGQIADLGQVITGKTPPTSDPENYGHYMPFITIPDMHNQVYVISTERYLSEKGVTTQSNKTLPPNTVCVSCIGSVGIVAITVSSAQTNQQINSVIPFNEATSYYVFWSLRLLGERLKAFGTGGSVLLNVNKRQFESIRLLIANQELMHIYQKIVAPLFHHIITNQQENITLANLRDSLLPKLLSGEIRVGKLVTE